MTKKYRRREKVLHRIDMGRQRLRELSAQLVEIVVLAEGRPEEIMLACDALIGAYQELDKGYVRMRLFYSGSPGKWGAALATPSPGE